MAPTSAIFVLALYFLPAVAIGRSHDAASCGKVPPRAQYTPPDASTDGCTCGSRLRNVSVPLTSAFRLKAACYLRWSFSDKETAIDLSKDRVSFEKYTQGNLPRGELLLIGTARLDGTLTHHEGPSGEWWFAPEGRPIATRGPLVPEFSSLKLTRKHSPREFQVPRSLAYVECWQAKATLIVTNIWLMIGDTDEAGAYPAKYSVVDVSGHRKCK